MLSLTSVEDHEPVDDLEVPVRLSTANGGIKCDKTASVQTRVGTIKALALPTSSPNLLSIGQLVTEGWSFMWTPKKGARLRTPSGQWIALKVRNNVPILAAAAARS